MPKTDAYTKVVLTIIAACLLWQCVNSVNVLTVAAAQTGGSTHTPSGGIGAPTKVIVVGVELSGDEAAARAPRSLPVTIVGVDRKGAPGPANALLVANAEDAK